MKKKLKSSGNGWELYFDKPLLKLLSYNPDETKVLITAKNDCLVVEPIEEKEIEKHPYSMIKGFQKSGKNGRALYFPTSLIDYIEITPDAELLDIVIDGSIMYIRKAQP